jgi:hypothetical protein
MARVSWAAWLHPLNLELSRGSHKREQIGEAPGGWSKRSRFVVRGRMVDYPLRQAVHWDSGDFLTSVQSFKAMH